MIKILVIYIIFDLYLLIKGLIRRCNDWEYYKKQINEYEMKKELSKNNPILTRLHYGEHCDRRIELYKYSINQIEWQTVLMFILFPLLPIEAFLHELLFWISGLCSYYTINSDMLFY